MHSITAQHLHNRRQAAEMEERNHNQAYIALREIPEYEGIFYPVDLIIWSDFKHR